MLYFSLYLSFVEGLNVINDHKCNKKILNVITFCPKCNEVLSCKLQWLLKLAPHLGEFNKRRCAYPYKYGTKRYYYGFKRRIFGEKI